MPPFIIYALPRSRTAWLAAFLTYGEWVCHHEQAIFLRHPSDIKERFSRAKTGYAETAAAAGWALIHRACPDVREVVIRRPVEDVIESVMAVDISGVAVYDRRRLEAGMKRGIRSLERISAHPGVLTVNYADLEREDVCAEIFEHCLPYRFDRDWYRSMAPKNIQADVKAVLTYFFANKPEIDNFKAECKRELWNICHHRRAARVLEDA